ncbi:MAG TPA: hypothetical protein VNK41_03085 [Vicinamibacterales bacterium]|nr:hypothetical protein [Vicinamibacterales bacterium]
MAGSRKRALVTAIVAGAAVAAIVAVLAARGRQSPEADKRELQAYRLTLAKVRQMNDAYAALFKALHEDPQFQSLQRAREELSALESKEDLTADDEERIAELEDEIDNAEGSAVPDIGEHQSLSDMEAAIEAQPRLAAAIRSAGLTPREFTKIQLSLFQAMFAYNFLKSGTLKALPAEVPKENVDFVRQHEQELTTMAKQWEAVSGRNGDSTPEDEGLDEEPEESEGP